MNANRFLVPGAVALVGAAVAIPAVASPASDSGVRAAGTKTVQVKDNYFSPRTLSVSRGTVLKFVWKGRGVHNVAVGRNIVISNRRSGSGSRRVSGSVTYNCTLHRGMNLTVRAR